MAFVFLLAQLLLAAHNPADAEDASPHTKAECVFCLAAPIAPDPEANIARAPAPTNDFIRVISPVATVGIAPTIHDDASPRGPPHA